MSEDLLIRIALGDAVVADRRIVGDALLGGFANKMLGDGPVVDEWLEAAIDHWHGVPMISQAMCESEMDVSSRTFIYSPLRTFERHPELVERVSANWSAMNPMAGMHRRLLEREGAMAEGFETSTATRRMVLTPAFRFFARGDASRIEALLTNAFQARRRVGANRG